MKTGTIIYFADKQSDFPEQDVQKVIEQFELDSRLCTVATESDMYDQIRLLLQRGAKNIEAICIKKESDGSINRIGNGTRIYG